MKNIFLSIILFFLCTVNVWAQPAPQPNVPLEIKDEGVDQGPVDTLNCVGTNVTCTVSASTGIITVSGGGDVSSNTSTSVDSEICLFNGTTGKSIKRANGTGFVKVTSGVISYDNTTYAPLTSANLITPNIGAATGTSLTLTGNMFAGASSNIGFTGRSILSSPSDGVITLSNLGLTDFTRLQFGGTTASFPSIKRNTTGIDLRLADDSAYTSIAASIYYLNSTSSYIDTSGSAARFVIGSNGHAVIQTTGIEIAAADRFGWSSDANPLNALDTGLSRISAGVVGVGTGGAGSVAGKLQLANVSLGTTTTASALEVGSTTTGLNGRFYSTLGAEQAATLVAGNWTQGTGWASPIAGGVLDKNADGTGTNTPSAATNIVSGTTYQVVITVSVWSVGSATVSIGGGQAKSLTAATTYTSIVTASSTAKLVITPTSTSRFTISSISIKPLTTATGTLTADGGIITSQPSAMNTINITSGDINPVSITDPLGNTLLTFTGGVNPKLNLGGTAAGQQAFLQIGSGGFIDSRGSNVMDISANNGGSSEKVIEVRSTAFGSLGYNAVVMPSGSIFGFISATSMGGGSADTTISRVAANVLGVGSGTAGSTAGELRVNLLGNPNNAIAAVANAATVPVTSTLSTVTNNSAAGLTITITTTGAVDGQVLRLRIYDATNVAQTLTLVNTENSTVTAPANTNGSTTLPLTLEFMFNSQTTKWRLIRSV